jgi:hypothetical protein
MKKIDIKISKAQIENFMVILNNEAIPDVHVTVALISDNGKKITSFSLASNHYQEEKKFDLPMGLHMPILEIMKELEKVVVARYQENQLQLN